MKTSIVALFFSLVSILSSISHAAKSVGSLSSTLQQFECTIKEQHINPENGKLGKQSSRYFIVVATDEEAAKAATLNKLDIYGPVDGEVFYQTQSGSQFKVSAINCH